MATITEIDVADVLAKMPAGGFTCLFIVKGDGEDLDQVVTYPTDGEPMPAAAVQSVLVGFLKACPVPMVQVEEGEDVPMYSSLEWLAVFVRDSVKAHVNRGLQRIEAENANNPMPE